MRSNLILLIAFLIILSSCADRDSGRIKEPKEIYNEALEKFNDEDYLDAKQLFDIVKLQYPASEFAEYSQYYLGECEYLEKNYILAAFNYNSLRRIYPSSSYSKESMYKAAMCYYHLSPSFERDQEYTRKAISAFQEFQYTYPGDSLSKEADQRINELRNKLAKKEYQTAEIYLKLQSPRSSLIYYDEVISRFDDTEYYEPAYYGKTMVLVSLRRYDEALGLINLYPKIFPEGKFNKEMKNLENISRERKSNLNKEAN